MAVSIYENVKRAIQDIVAPELRTLQGQIENARVEAHGNMETLRSEIRRLDEKIDSGYKSLNEKIEGVNKRIDGLDKRIDGLEEQIRNLRAEVLSTVDVHERIAAIEAKLSTR